MPASKEQVEQHLYKTHGSYPGSLVAASLDQLKQWHRHQHRVHLPIHGVNTPNYGNTSPEFGNDHNRSIPANVQHNHEHRGLPKVG